MEWMEIISALALGMFVVVMLPMAKNMVQNSPKGSTSDWISFVVTVVMIMLFVILLIELV